MPLVKHALYWFRQAVVHRIIEKVIEASLLWIRDCQPTLRKVTRISGVGSTRNFERGEKLSVTYFKNGNGSLPQHD
jgi:hypothetical protein